MSDAVQTQVIQNGNQIYIAKFTNFSDGTGESAVTKLDPTSSGDMGVNIAGNVLYPGTHLKIMRMNYTVSGMTLRVYWDATTARVLWFLQGFGKMDFHKHGGLYVPQSGGAPVTGATGKVLFTTEGAGAGSSYTVEMWCQKDIVQ
jgi:hypothetical protein